MTPKQVLYACLIGRNALVSFAHPCDIKHVFSICDNVILDNGAFSFWNKGYHKIEWEDYYAWIERFPSKQFFFIPDVIEGSEKENDSLIEKCPIPGGVPIWHLNESLERLMEISKTFSYIALGSSSTITHCGTKEQMKAWVEKMENVMRILCTDEGIPTVKIHMLRCLNPRVFTKYPFHSGDSANVARNHHRYNTHKADEHTGVPCSYDGWQKIIKRIEAFDAPTKYTFAKKPTMVQMRLI